jgi:hypothetical protein
MQIFRQVIPRPEIGEGFHSQAIPKGPAVKVSKPPKFPAINKNTMGALPRVPGYFGKSQVF